MNTLYIIRNVSTEKSTNIDKYAGVFVYVAFTKRVIHQVINISDVS